jgi:hypothetical protein
MDIRTWRKAKAARVESESEESKAQTCWRRAPEGCRDVGRQHGAPMANAEVDLVPTPPRLLAERQGRTSARAGIASFREDGWRKSHEDLWRSHRGDSSGRPSGCGRWVQGAWANCLPTAWLRRRRRRPWRPTSKAEIRSALPRLAGEAVRDV